MTNHISNVLPVHNLVMINKLYLSEHDIKKCQLACHIRFVAWLQFNITFVVISMALVGKLRWGVIILQILNTDKCRTV